MLQHTSWKRLGLAVLTIPLLVAGLAACRPAGPTGPPQCFGAHMTAPADPIISADIARAFADTPDVNYFEHIVVPRESGCDPNAINRSSGALGLFQLLGHNDLISAACPFNYPLPWNDPWCNSEAARLLYQQGGRAPWALADGGHNPDFVLVSVRLPVATVDATPYGPQWFIDGISARQQYENAVNLWDFIKAASYAQTIIDAQASQIHYSSSGGGSGGGGSCPADNGSPPAGFPGYIIQRESGGDPGAVNSSSGACGRAQILPSHFGPGGGCAGQSYSQCWATLWAGGSGSSNWALTR